MKTFEQRIQEFIDSILFDVTIQLNMNHNIVMGDINAVVDHHYWEMHLVELESEGEK